MKNAAEYPQAARCYRVAGKARATSMNYGHQMADQH